MICFFLFVVSSRQHGDLCPVFNKQRIRKKSCKHIFKTNISPNNKPHWVYQKTKVKATSVLQLQACNLLEGTDQVKSSKTDYIFQHSQAHEYTKEWQNWKIVVWHCQCQKLKKEDTYLLRGCFSQIRIFHWEHLSTQLRHQKEYWSPFKKIVTVIVPLSVVDIPMSL